MKIAICDDEKKLRKDLRHLAEVHLDLAGMDYIIEEFSSGEELTACEDLSDVQILFLDIEMDGIDGMETAKRLRAAGRKMLIIFVTAYPDYVFDGYEVQAFHYILKPYQEAKIKEVLDRAIAELSLSHEHFLVVEQKSGTLRIDTSKILYFKSDRRNIFAATKASGTESFYGKLDDVEAEMPKYFQRVHNRYLVNLNYVSKVGATSCICGEEEIPVSRAYKQELAVAFAQMMLK